MTNLPTTLIAFSIVLLFNAYGFAQQGEAPVANDDFWIIDGRTPTIFNVFANDSGDIDEYTTVTPASYGNSFWYDFHGTVAYTPGNSHAYSYSDTIAYQVCTDSPQRLCSAPATLTILVIGIGDNASNYGSCPTKRGPPVAPANAGKPVNVVNGNMWLAETDYSLPGPGENIEINRFYNSLMQSSGLFGHGWSTKYDESITVYDSRMARLNLPDGKGVFFGRPNTTTEFVSVSADFTGHFTKESDDTFTLTELDGTVHKFDAGGRLSWLRDRNGNQTTLTYDLNNFLSGVTDAFGRTLTLTPNANGKITRISDSLGDLADYDYDTTGDFLTAVNYPDGSKFKFDYVNKIVDGQTQTYLATVKDALDNILETHLYDEQGRAYTSEKQGGAEKYTFSFMSDYTNVTDALGRTTKYDFTSRNGKDLITRVEGACSCGSGGSEAKTFEYNNYSLNPTKITDALGRETTYEYDASRNVKKQTDAFGVQEFTYNSFGEILTYKDRMGGVWTNTYNSSGNLQTITDALGNVTTIEYPKTGNKGLPDSVKDARNNVTLFRWYTTGTQNGLLQEIEDPYGNKTTFTHDARGRMLTRKQTVTVPGDPTPVDLVTEYKYYDDAQRKVEMIYPNLDKVTYNYDIRRLLESVTDERGKITAYEFDPQYRLKKITDPLGHVKEFGYDLMSNRTSYKDPLGNITTYVPDDFNRIKEIDYPAAEAGATALKETFEYDKVGRIQKHYDTANRLTQYGYDDATRTNTVTNAELETTTTTYNQRFQTIEVKDAINQVYSFGYDPMGRMLSQTRAGGTMFYLFDEVGNPKQRTDYAGRITNYTFDKLNRLTKIEYDNPAVDGVANPTDKQQSVYGYDEISRLTSAANEAGTVTFNYDSRNRLKNTTDVFGHLLEYEYELTPTVNQKSLKFDGSMYAAYNFDDAGRLTSLVNSADSSAISFGYDAEDKLTSRTYPNGITTTYDYFNNDLLKRLKDANGAATLFDRQYTYNTANQIDSIAELTKTRTFAYDQVDRLKTVTSSDNQNESYSYDHVGNRTSSHLSATYGYQTGQFNQLTSTATATYSLDANGNTTSKSEGSNLWRYTWDTENRLTQAATRKQAVRYKYDALGRRIQRVVGFGKENTKFIYDGEDVLADDDSGSLTKYQNGPDIDNKLRVQSGTDVNYFLADHLGSTNALADSNGALTSSTAYDSFGNATNPSFPSRYQFTGREYDGFSGLQYSRARFYDPTLGRFISEDPIGFGGGDVNLYGYVWNSPVSFTDPMGMDGFGNDFANWAQNRSEYARNYWKSDPQNWVFNGTIDTACDLANGFADMFRVGSGLGYALYASDLPDYRRFELVSGDVVRGGSLFLTMAGPVAGRLGNARAAEPNPAPVVETPTNTGLGRAPKQSTPNSIYEQMDGAGNLRSRTFYDDNGYPFTRQDFDHAHGGLQPHEHNMGFDADGRPNVKKTFGPLPPGY